MDPIEAKLTNADGAWSTSVLGDDVWSALVERAIALLGHALRRDLALDHERAPSWGEIGFSVWARERCTPAADVSVRAIVGADRLPHGLLVRACIFYYVGDRRVGPVVDATELPGANNPSPRLLTAEFRHGDLVVDVHGRAAWRLGAWDLGFTDDEFGAFARW